LNHGRDHFNCDARADYESVRSRRVRVQRRAYLRWKKAGPTIETATLSRGVSDFLGASTPLARAIPRAAGAQVFALHVGVISPQLTAALFLIAQVTDGVLTYAALQYFGPAAEGNPLLAIWIGLIGPGSTIVGAKMLAIGCGIILYAVALHRVLLALTIFYAAAAVGPWLAIFQRLA
jgi:hypothetical protein